MTDAPKLKPQEVVDILASSFRLYLDNFFTFLGILAAAYVPLMLVGVMMSGMMFTRMEGILPAPGEHPDPAKIFAALGPVMALGGAMSLLSMIAFALATGALTRAVGLRYLNQPADFGSCWRYITGIFMKYLGTNMLFGLVVGLGFLLCIIPGFVFMVWFTFTSSIVVLEGLGGTAALRRSRDLARGSAGRILGLAGLMVAIQVGLHMGVGAVIGLAIPRLVPGPAAAAMVNNAIVQAVSMVVTPFFSVAWILLYYDLRIRKEAFDLEVLAKDMADRRAQLAKGGDAPPA